METPPLIRRPESLRTHVENYLRDSIMNGMYQPGERLIERDLCATLNVSRPSLREALRRLEAEKLITNVLHRGPVVASITIAEASELYAVRALLESHAVAEFTRLATDDAVAELGKAVQALHMAAASGDRMSLLAAKSTFYALILKSCGNALIKEMLLSLLTRINLLRATSFSQPQRLAESLKEIDHLYARVLSRDASGARQAAQRHILNAEKTALRLLEQQLQDSSGAAGR